MAEGTTTGKPLYRVVGWDAFENHESRKLKTLSWIAMPNHHDGAGYRSLIGRPNGAALYGAWCVLVQIASRCPPPRGRIVSPGGPLGSLELALKTGFPAAIFEELFTVACDPSVGWLERISGDSPGIARNLPELPGITPIQGREGKGTEVTPLPPKGAGETLENKDTHPLRGWFAHAYVIDGSDPSADRRLGRLAKRAVALGATAETLTERRKLLRGRYGDKSDTPEALLKHYGALSLTFVERKYG